MRTFKTTKKQKKLYGTLLRECMREKEGERERRRHCQSCLCMSAAAVAADRFFSLQSNCIERKKVKHREKETICLEISVTRQTVSVCVRWFEIRQEERKSRGLESAD